MPSLDEKTSSALPIFTSSYDTRQTAPFQCGSWLQYGDHFSNGSGVQYRTEMQDRLRTAEIG